MWKHYCNTPEIIKAEDLLNIVKAFYGIQRKRGIYQNTVHLTGLEPTLWRNGHATIVDLMRLLRDNGLSVELTTNGTILREFANSLASVGVKKIRISLSSMNPEKYVLITGYDYLSCVMDGLEKALREDVEVKINYLLLSETYRDIDDIMIFVADHNITLKLMKLHWSVSASQLSRIDPMHVINELVISHCTRETVECLDSPIRETILYPLKKGGAVEVKLPVKGGLETYFPFCRTCEYLHSCSESTSLVPPGVWLMPDLALTFCPFKKEPKIDLKQLLLKNPTQELMGEFIEQELDNTIFHGTVPNFALPIRAIITSRCNLCCVFCHAEGFKHDKLTQTKENEIGKRPKSRRSRYPY
jgi:molybdenum cofactor biosynthesis enzyme MoaA